MENEGEFLALKLVSGQYAYSMEATCPKGRKKQESVLEVMSFFTPQALTCVSQSVVEDVLLYLS